MRLHAVVLSLEKHSDNFVLPLPLPSVFPHEWQEVIFEAGHHCFHLTSPDSESSIIL
jgi:hypothetical protein